MSLRYAEYARKSQEDVGRQVQSIENQLEENQRIADRDGLDIRVSLKESKSAWEPNNRPEFSRMISLIEKGEIDGIVAWHPDRLSRNETDAATITRLLRSGALKDLRFASYHFINSPDGIMMLQHTFSQSQYQTSKMAVDVRRGLESKRRAGWYPHRAPEGYLNERQTNTIITDPERFDLIRAAWNLMLTGSYTTIEAVDAINAMGYRTRIRKNSGGRPLARSSAYRIFTNPFYTGRFREKGFVHPGSHPPMVTDEEFDQVQKIIQSRSTPHATRHERPYSGLIRCGKCGWGITSDFQRGANNSGEYVYLHCSNRACNRKSLRQDRFEETVLQYLRSIEIHDWILNEVLKQLKEWEDSEIKAEVFIAKEQVSASEEARKSLDRLLDLLVREVIDELTYSQKRKEIEEQLRGIRKAERELAQRDVDVRMSLKNGLDFANLALQIFKTGGPKARRQILETLAVDCVFENGQARLTLHPLFESISKAKKALTELKIFGSGSTKKKRLSAPVLHGWTSTSYSELLQVCSESKHIPRLLPRAHIRTQIGEADRHGFKPESVF